MNRFLPLLFLGLALPAQAADLPPQTAFINEQIAAKWKEADIRRPAARATDAEFLRRVYLDLLGRIATPLEFEDFEADASVNKRARLVRRLMAETAYKPRPKGGFKPNEKPVTFNYVREFNEHWAGVWTNWLLGRGVDNRARTEMKTWLLAALNQPGFNHKEMVANLLTASGKSGENGAIHFIAQQLGDTNPSERREELGTYDAVPITSRVTRLFMGLQTQCTQCHDHPTNKEWVQSDFWGVNAYFRQTLRKGTLGRVAQRDEQMINSGVIELYDDVSINADGRVYFERRDGQLKAVRPVFLKDMAQADRGERSEKFAPTDGRTRRQALAEYVTTHDNFAPAYINRMWGHFFGRGLNQEPAVDDFGSHNEVVHPELLARLANDIAEYNYDPKHVMEWICLSDAYNLSYVAPSGAANAQYDVYMARMPLKALSPEALFDSLQVALTGQVGTASSSRQNWLRKLVQQFGDDEGNEMTFNGTIVQALLMMNGPELNSEIAKTTDTTVARAVRANTSRNGYVSIDGILDDLFVAALNRHITPDERSKLKTVMAKGAVVTDVAAPKPSEKKAGWQRPPEAIAGMVSPVSAQDLTFYQDVFWALLNSNEFMLNH